MIIVMALGATPEQIQAVVDRLRAIGADAHVSSGQKRTVIGAVGDRGSIQQLPWEAMEGVERAVPVLKEFKFVSREFQADDSVIRVGDVPVGGGHFAMMAGPCAVESREQLMASAQAVRKAGAVILRGDAFKPRTSPYSFQGLGEEGLQYMREARDLLGMPFIAEVLDPRDVELVSKYADLIRVGTRNMANFTLLREIGRQDKPVLLKRGFTATVDEWLNAAEYIYKEGNHDIIMCERGIRTYEPSTRNTLDISAVAVVKRLSHLPVIVDPSHSGGHRYLVAPLAKAAVAIGADGLLIDVHTAPETAKVDGAQALLPDDFAALMDDLRKLGSAVGVSI
jgi:3-deoxy-7-phosphoheptulonate synthase